MTLADSLKVQGHHGGKEQVVAAAAGAGAGKMAETGQEAGPDRNIKIPP